MYYEYRTNTIFCVYGICHLQKKAHFIWCSDWSGIGMANNGYRYAVVELFGNAALYGVSKRSSCRIVTRKFNELSLLLEQIANDRTMAQEFWGLKQTNHTLYIDVNRHCVILEQQEVYLSTNEFEVLYLLLQSPQTTFTKEQIYEQIWHEPTNNHLHAVENTIFQIRKRLKPYCKGHEYIKTVIGYGYKFNSE